MCVTLCVSVYTAIDRVKASPVDAFREHQDDTALRPTGDNQALQ